MTPFGVLMRYWRETKQKTLQDQATFLDVSAAYLSALEHGKKGRPSFVMVDQVCVFLDLIWDEAEALKQAAALSHPKPVIDASALSADAVRLSNLLALNIDRLSEEDCKSLCDEVTKRL